MTRILVIGEAIADFLPTDDEPSRFACVLGGSGFNTALALARLGASPDYAGTLSTDALGKRFHRALAAEGVGMGTLTRSDAPTPVAIVSPQGASHGAMFALHLAGTAHEGPAALPERLPPGVVHVHAASFAATVGAAAHASLALLREGRALASSSYDPNIRAACLPPRAEAVPLIEARVAASTIAKASVEDMAWLYPGLAPQEALERWSALGCPMPIVTRGERGALALGRQGFVEAPSPRVEVADTVGAGDTFTAALLAAMGRDGALGPASRADSAFTPERLSRWLGFACRAAAFTCARPGCDPPRLAELGPMASL